MGASDLSGRVLASLGKGGPVDSHFEACADVPKGGVLLALPALLASGLWERTEEHFELPQGYYQMVHVFLLVVCWRFFFAAVLHQVNLEAGP